MRTTKKNAKVTKAKKKAVSHIAKDKKKQTRTDVNQNTHKVLECIFMGLCEGTYLNEKHTVDTFCTLVCNNLDLLDTVMLQEFILQHLIDMAKKGPDVYPIPKICFTVMDRLGLLVDRKAARAATLRRRSLGLEY